MKGDSFTGPSKRGWKLYREKVSGWQEYYTERLIEDYVVYLDSNEPTPARFWIMEKCMKRNKRTPRVCTELNKRNMIFDLVRFLQGEAVVLDDLDELSEELRESAKLLKKRFGRLECKRTGYHEWRCGHRYVYMKKYN